MKKAVPFLDLVGGTLLFFAGLTAMIDSPRHWWFVALMGAGIAVVIRGILIFRQRRRQSGRDSDTSPR